MRDSRVYYRTLLINTLHLIKLDEVSCGGVLPIKDIFLISSKGTWGSGLSTSVAPPLKIREAPGWANSAAETRPPAAVSATEMVSLRERSRVAREEAAAASAWGGNSAIVAELTKDSVWTSIGYPK